MYKNVLSCFSTVAIPETTTTLDINKEHWTKLIKQTKDN